MPDNWEEHRPALTNFARANLPFGHKDDAEDMVQESYLHELERNDGREKNSVFRHTAVKNQVVDHIRHERAQKRGGGHVVSLEHDIFPEASETPVDALIRAEQAKIIHNALELLSDKQRAAIEAYYFEGKSHPEIAEQQETNKNTIKSRIHSAHTLLRQILS